MRSIGWLVAPLGKWGGYAYVRGIPLIGSVIKIQRPKKIDYKVISSLSKKYKAFQIILEPTPKTSSKQLTAKGFRLSRSYFAPSKTLQINLTKTEKQLLKEMHYKTRYNIRRSKVQNLKSKISNDVVSFANFWQKCTNQQRGVFLPQKKEIIAMQRTFGKKTLIVQVLRKSQVLSAVMLIFTNKSAHYMYAAASLEGKKLFAPTLNAWMAIKLAKKLGCRVFDFEGIYDERFPVKSWVGFTRFKKSFGGHEIEYPGSYTKYRLPF